MRFIFFFLIALSLDLFGAVCGSPDVNGVVTCTQNNDSFYYKTYGDISTSESCQIRADNLLQSYLTDHPDATGGYTRCELVGTTIYEDSFVKYNYCPAGTVWDNDSQQCITPICELPQDELVIQNFDSQTACEDYLNNTLLPSLDGKDVLGTLHCYGCLDSSNNWNGALFQDTNGASCPVGSPVQDSSGVMYCEACSPLSSFVEPLDQASCYGFASDYDKGVSGSLVWQDCDQTCYLTEASPIACSDMIDKKLPDLQNICDPDLNDLNVTCTEGSISNNIVTAPTIDYTCTPKGSRVSPCNEDLKNWDCGEGYKLAGNCHDNGAYITENTRYCKEITNSPDDCDPNTEKWDDVQKTCVCADGFVADAYGSCWLPEGSGDTSGTDTNSSANDLVREQKNHKILKDMKKSLGDIASDLNQTNDLLKSQADTLSSIRGDLNVSNNLLNKIADKLDFNTSFDFPVDKGNAFHDKVMGVLGTVSTGFDSIKSDFDRMLAKANSGFSSNPISTGTSPSFSGTVMGQNIKFDMCSIAGPLSSVVYWIAYVSLLILGLRIFFYAFTLRG